MRAQTTTLKTNPQLFIDVPLYILIYYLME